MGIFQIAHAGKWDIDRAVYIRIPLLHLGGQHADHCKAESVEPNVLAQRIASGK